MKLSVLVPTVSVRKGLLSRLLWGLEPQLYKDVEVVICKGDTDPMGKKYNRMFQEAKGDYVACVDDDDYLASDYVQQVLSAIEKGDFDYISYGILHTEDGRYMSQVVSSKDGDHTWQKQPYGVLPKCVLKRSIAKDFEFPNHHSGDQEWARAIHLSGRVQSEYIIDRVLYFYDFDLEGTLGTTPGSPNVETQRDVGLYPYNKKKFRWLN